MPVIALESPPPLELPRLRPGVRRPRLTEAIDAEATPFVVLVAPAGYGKTTLLREWCAHDPRPSVWLRLDRRHEDPLALLRAIARAVDEGNAGSRDGRIVLVIDDVHVLRTPAARETLASIARQPPEGMTIALASRAELPLPVARLRAEGLVTELRTGALAMTRREAADLCRAAGLRLDADALDALMRRTEGWPAGLALAAASLEPHAGTASVARFDGRDRLVADYLRDEILDGLSAEERELVLCTSVLDGFTAALCDALLERPGAAELLMRLQRSGFPLVALDRHGERFRHHHLLQDLLRAELRRGAPELEAALHLRACAWHAQAGELEHALHHALAAGDPDRASELVWEAVPSALERDAGGVVEHWLSLFDPADVVARPQLALAAAAAQLARGQGDLAEHWLRTAGAAPEAAGGVAALRAALGRDGLNAMRADAARASALLEPDSPCQALVGLAAGVAAHLRGDREVARARLEDAARRAAVRVPQVHALCLAQLALLALDEDEREEAARLAARARAQVERGRLSRYASSALVLAVSALVRAQRGNAEDARRDATAAGELLECLTDFAPWYAAEAELTLARAALRLSDVNEARERVGAARSLAGRIAGATTLEEWVQTTAEDVAAYRASTSRLRLSLTGAELRILQFLPTHLSFREIGERTCVTANTVKTQANAVYRKLDVRSRSEAVVRARELGLLDT